jgi:hypothetical protein
MAEEAVRQVIISLGYLSTEPSRVVELSDLCVSESPGVVTEWLDEKGGGGGEAA